MPSPWTISLRRNIWASRSWRRRARQHRTKKTNPPLPPFAKGGVGGFFYQKRLPGFTHNLYRVDRLQAMMFIFAEVIDRGTAFKVEAFGLVTPYPHQIAEVGTGINPGNQRHVAPVHHLVLNGLDHDPTRFKFFSHEFGIIVGGLAG